MQTLLPMKDILISASILSADFSRLGEQIRELEAGGVDWIHIDVMDGHFVPNLTMGPFVVDTVRKITRLPIDVHLMVENPDQMIPWFANAGANRISAQIETCPHIFRTLESIRSLGCEPGVVLNPGTPAYAISQVLHQVSLILVMTVNPGYSGQAFIPEVLPKIAQIDRMLVETGSPARIQVDGGITTETIVPTYTAGARIFVSATSLFKYPQGIAAGISALRKAVL
jgi:ribulose-phosphate 3-epimerase